MYKGGTQINVQTMHVPVIINETKIYGVVDSGAQVSILSTALYNRLSKKPVLSDQVYIKGISTVGRIRAEVAEKVPFRIGKTDLQLNMLVADINDEMILGLDFLNLNKAIVDYGQYTMNLNQEVILASDMSSNEGGSTRVYRVTVARTTVISPHTAQFIQAELNEKPNVDIVIQPSSTLDRILSPNCLCRPNKEVFLLVRNPSDNKVTLKKKQLFGSGIEAHNLIEDDQDQNAVNVRTAKTDNSENNQLPDHLTDLYQRTVHHLSNDQADAIKKLLIEYQDVFSKGDLDIGLFNGDVKHRINTGDAAPVRQKLRRTPLSFEKEEEEHLKQMLEKNVIQVSNSQWAATPVLVRKKDGSLRYCVDYRALNKLTVKDAFPLPNINSCIDALGGNVYMSTLDMAAGYWQLEIDPQDRFKTAFITKYGQFEHVKLAFGLCNSPATFSRVIQLVLQGLTWSECLAYLDDVIVLGDSFNSHLLNLERVLNRFRQYSLKLKPKKCSLFQKEVKFLGKIVSGDGVKVNPENVEAVKKWSTPKNKKDVESFLGFMNYHREHIPGFAKLALPLHEIARPREPFKWQEEQGAAFESLKQSLVNAVVLNYPNSNDRYVLDTDASDGTIGAELSQIQEGKEKSISFSSKVLTPAQRKYCTTRKELLAIVTFTRQYRHYLLGRPFIVRTDHNSLTWLLNFKNVEGQLARWIEELSQYNMVIQHRAGKHHCNADGLSRISDALPACPEYQPIIELDQLPCGGCKYCRRAREQWEIFEQEVDYVQPISVRRISSEEGGCNWIEVHSPKEVAEEQRRDKDLNCIIGWLENNHQPSTVELQLSGPAVRHFWSCRSQLHFLNSVLYYDWEDPVKPRKLLMIPKTMRTQILELCHNIPLSGHMGQIKTLMKIKEYALWYRMAMDCKLYVKSCGICNKNKRAKDHARAKLGQYHAGIPVERVHMDILGPLPLTDQKNKYILMVIDQFTKWLECYPIPNQTAETVASVLIDGFISRFGCPVELHTDQGKNMDGVLIRQLCSILQIKKTRTTPYHPSSNGQVERYNSLLLQIIRCFLKRQQNKWDKHLQLLVGAIRATPNRQTGFSANFLMFGREVLQPIDLSFGLMTVNQQEKGTLEYIQDLIISLNLVHDIARDNLKASQLRQKKDYDLRTTTRSYHIGDAVYKIDTATKIGQSRKLKPPWKGPYLVTRVINPVLFEIVDRKKTWIVHHDRLKSCTDGELPIWLQRRRSSLLGERHEQETNIADDDLSLETLFGEKGLGTSDIPMTQDATVETSDIPMYSAVNETRLKHRETANNMSDLNRIEDLDETVVYDFEEPVAEDAEQSLDNVKTKRKARKPAYLSDYTV